MTNLECVNTHGIIAGNISAGFNDANIGINRMKFITLATVAYILTINQLAPK